MFKATHKFAQLCKIGSLVFIVTGIFFLTLSALAQTTPIDFETFTGVGFQPGGGGGTLDSDLWAVTGFSEGDCGFTGICTTGDFARGPSTGGETQGGIYAFDTSATPGGSITLGVQPIAVDFTPGTFTLRVVNTTGGTVANVYVSYEIWVLNDANRSNSFNFSHSPDNVTYTSVSTLDFTSTASPDALGWQLSPRNTIITGVNLANGDDIFLRWTGDDAGSTGSRDEFGLDNVEVRVNGPTAVTLETFNFEPAHPSAWIAAMGILLLILGSLGLWWARRAGNR